MKLKHHADMLATRNWVRLFALTGHLPFFPFIQICPDLGCSSNPAKFSNVVLPAPDGPTSAVIRPG